MISTTDAEGKAIVRRLRQPGAHRSLGEPRDHDRAFGGVDSTLVASDAGCGSTPRPRPVHHGRCGREQPVSVARLEASSFTVGRRFRTDHRVCESCSTAAATWNKTEHRLFRHITANWRGTPLTTYETIVDRIAERRTETGLQVRAELDAGESSDGRYGDQGTDGRTRAGPR